MTNKEKFRADLDKLLGYKIAIVNGIPCDCSEVRCKTCDFNNNIEVSCINQLHEWLDEEYQMTNKEYQMTNKEYYREDLDDLLGYVIAVVKGKPCRCTFDIWCNECDLHNKQGCRKNFRKWLDEEHTERK